MESPMCSPRPSITPLQARQYVARWAAKDLHLRPGWIYACDGSSTDRRLLEAAAEVLATQLDLEAAQTTLQLQTEGQRPLPDPEPRP
jgi:hypothetical protein